MVWTETDYDSFKLIWVDGYAPDQAQVIEKAKALGRAIDRPETTKNDYLCKRVIASLRGMHCRDMMSEAELDKIKWRHCDTFYFGVVNRPTPEISMMDILREDLDYGRHLGENYNHIAFVLDGSQSSGCNSVPRCIDSVIKKTLQEFDFKIREPSSYKDLGLFQKSCKAILERMRDIYNVPGLVCEDLIERQGFTCDSSCAL